MIENLERLVNLLGLISKHIDPKTMSPEGRTALAEAAQALVEKAKVAIEQILLSLEKDIKDGKITDHEMIQKIREYRDRYNAL